MPLLKLLTMPVQLHDTSERSERNSEPAIRSWELPVLQHIAEILWAPIMPSVGV